jgi:hypothetical protein
MAATEVPMASPPSQNHPASDSWKIIPFFRSANIPETLSFYKETLNVKSGPLYPSESDPRFVSLSWGPKAAVNIYFRIYGTALNEDQQRHQERGQAMVALPTPDDVTKLHEHLTDCGLHRQGQADHKVQKFRQRCDVTDVEDMEWGYRQFTMQDIDGNEIAFFSFLENEE